MLFPYAQMPLNGFIETGGANAYQTHKAVHHNVSATPGNGYVLGQIIPYFNATIGGYGACVYCTCTEATGDPIVVGDCVTLTAGSHIDLTNDASAGAVGDYAAEGGFPAAIALSSMTTTYCGWFWIKGVCPDLYTAAATKLSANTGITSAGSIGAMSAFIASTTDGAIALHDRDAANTDTEVMGMSLAADSTNANIFANVRLTGAGWGI